MDIKPTNVVIEFAPDAESTRILQGMQGAERDKYINDAIKAFSAKAPVQTTAASKPTSPAEQVTAELTRLFGTEFDAIKSSPGSSDQTVVLTEASSRLQAKCATQDALDILKSLRQPITEQEVWEILSCLG